MPSFSKNSQTKLDTCHPFLMRLFYEVVKNYDCTIIYGHRTPEEQFKLYKKGRHQINGRWYIKDRSKVVTYRDGILKSSDHNCYPSLAVDVMPCPVDWKDIPRTKEFAAYVKGYAANMKIPVKWGGDWTRFKDYAHWYLPEDCRE